MERSTKPRCDCHFNILAPRALVDAVQAIAARNYQSANSYARAALLKALERDGVNINEAASQAQALRAAVVTAVDVPRCHCQSEARNSVCQ